MLFLVASFDLGVLYLIVDRDKVVVVLLGDEHVPQKGLVLFVVATGRFADGAVGETDTIGHGLVLEPVRSGEGSFNVPSN